MDDTRDTALGNAAFMIENVSLIDMFISIRPACRTRHFTRRMRNTGLNDTP